MSALADCCNSSTSLQTMTAAPFAGLGIAGLTWNVNQADPESADLQLLGVVDMPLIWVCLQEVDMGVVNIVTQVWFLAIGAGHSTNCKDCLCALLLHALSGST